MNQNFKTDNLSDQFQRLSGLLNCDNLDDSCLFQVKQISSSILNALVVCGDDKNLPLLETFASLVPRYPEERAFFENFAQLVLMYLTNSLKFFQLKNAFVQSTNTNEPVFRMPSWWPEANGDHHLENITSIFDIALDLENSAKAHAFKINSIVHVVTGILGRIEQMTRDQHPPWSCFSNLISLMSRSVAHRDLTTYVLCQNESAINTLLRLSVPSASYPGDRYARFLLELLSTRSTCVVVFSAVHGFPGAVRLAASSPHHVKPALKVAANTPFQYIVDALNHQSDLLDFKNPTVFTCVLVATRKLEMFQKSGNSLAMYEAFNSASSINSLSSVVTQFGCMVARGLLENYGDFICSERHFTALDVFAKSKFPPLAKPNYFFTEQKAASANSTLGMMAKLDEYDEMHRSLARIMGFLKSILKNELDLVADMAGDRALAEKLYTCNINATYLLFFLVLRCNDKQEQSMASRVSSEAVFEIFEFLLQRPHPTLSWTALFSYATEMSYNEISSVGTWHKFLGTLCTLHANGPHKELVRDNLTRFCSVFDQPKAFAESTNPYIAVPAETCIIDKSEYMFLYQDPSRHKNSYDENLHTKQPNPYAIGGRQQSVHVDKYGKDRN